MRVIYKGEVVHVGTREEAYSDLNELTEEDFSVEIEELSYHPEDARELANGRATDFAAHARSSIVQEPDSLRRDGWTMKGLGAMFFLQAKAPKEFAKVLAGVEKSFAVEAERRGQGETSVELMQSSVQEFLKMLYSTSLVEGNLRGLQKAMDGAEPDQLEAILQGAKDHADSDMAMLQAAASA